jgi:DNA-binding transcriptional LysR family regulator
MPNRRFDLPPLDRLEAFEAAARNLSFTRAGAELSITQSAVSRAIASLEERLGFALFERRHRALLLTERGQALYRATTDMLERLHDTLAKMRGPGAAHALTVTTPLSFASLWLIPRLARFTRAHPGVDVRMAANNEIVDLDRSGIELAIRYSTAERAPGGAKLFGEEVFPVCSPALARDRARPIKRPEDLARHVLLHVDDAGQAPWLAWDPWFEAAGIPDLKPAGSLHFSHYDQLIQAAINGQGVALGRVPLLREQLRSGLLVAPFRRSVASPRCYYVMRSARSGTNPDVDAFIAWLHAEAATSASQPAPSDKTRRSGASR